MFTCLNHNTTFSVTMMIMLVMMIDPVECSRSRPSNHAIDAHRRPLKHQSLRTQSFPSLLIENQKSIIDCRIIFFSFYSFTPKLMVKLVMKG